MGTADRTAEPSGHHPVLDRAARHHHHQARPYHAKDRSDIELLTRIPGFRHERLTELYALAHDDMTSYWPDKLEKTDRNFHLVRTVILGLPPEDWGDDYD
jgi:hypothetical protein